MLVNGEMGTLDEVSGRIVVGFRQAVKGLLRGFTPRNDKQQWGWGMEGKGRGRERKGKR